jgi:Na+-transporting methylmalonyl-CoA/oxaloacetate decarboxylase gamma subunit
LKIGAIRIVWIFLALLAAFVIFIQCIAEVGGEAIPKPTPEGLPAPTAQVSPN